MTLDNNINETECTAEEIVGVNVPESENSESKEVPAEKKNRFKFKLNLGMFTSKAGRRNIIIAASFLLICGAVYMNWVFFSGDNIKDDTDSGYVIDYTEGDNSVVVGETNSTDYFSTTQISRQKARDEAIEVFQLVLDNEEALAEIKENALYSMSKIANFIEAEGNIESLVCAKGFADCVAVVNENSATIVVKSEGLLPNEVAQISEIVCEQTSLPVSAINIIEME